MTTVRQCIEGALRLIQEVGEGQSMTAQQGQDGLYSLVSMIESWSIEAGTVATETQESFTLTAGDGDYSIGSGDDFNTTQPTVINDAILTHSTNNQYPLRIVGQDEWASIPDKSTTGAPETLYYDGNGNIYIYPVPDQAYTLTLYSEKPISTYTNLSDDLAAPNGYERAFRYNLACEVAPEYGKSPSAVVVNIAVESKNTVINQNLKNDLNRLSADPALLGSSTYDIYTDEA